MQSCGSSWLGILRGRLDDIEAVFRGLWNLRATSGELEYRDAAQTIATFWTTPKNMRRFFFNHFFLPRENGSPYQRALKREAINYARRQLSELTGTAEKFINFDRIVVLPDAHSSGTITAEKPDNDMKDAILSHAFESKDSESKE